MPRKVVKKIAPRSVELDRSRTPIVLALMLCVGIGATAGTIMWGSSDAGQIDVSAAIANSQNIQNQESGAPNTPVPTEEHLSMPNGGLVPQAPDSSDRAPTPEPTPVDSGTSTATSTDSVLTDGEDPQVVSDTQENTEGDQSVTAEETSDIPPPADAVSGE